MRSGDSVTGRFAALWHPRSSHSGLHAAWTLRGAPAGTPGLGRDAQICCFPPCCVWHLRALQLRGRRSRPSAASGLSERCCGQTSWESFPVIALSLHRADVASSLRPFIIDIWVAESLNRGQKNILILLKTLAHRSWYYRRPERPGNPVTVRKQAWTARGARAGPWGAHGQVGEAGGRRNADLWALASCHFWRCVTWG